MQTESTLIEDINHPAAIPMDFDQMRAIARDRFQNYEHWVVVFDADSKQFIDRIARRFYKNAPADDFSVFVSAWRGRLFGTAILRKRRMLINQLRRELRKYLIDLSKKQMEARDLLIVTAPRNLLHGTDLAETILGNPDGPKVPVPPPVDGVWPRNAVSMN